MPERIPVPIHQLINCRMIAIFGVRQQFLGLIAFGPHEFIIAELTAVDYFTARIKQFDSNLPSDSSDPCQLHSNSGTMSATA